MTKHYLALGPFVLFIVLGVFLGTQDVSAMHQVKTLNTKPGAVQYYFIDHEIRELPQPQQGQANTFLGHCLAEKPGVTVVNNVVVSSSFNEQQYADCVTRALAQVRKPREEKPQEPAQTKPVAAEPECGSGYAVDPKTKRCREYVACPADKHFTRRGPFECGCEKLYRLTKDKSDCLFDGAAGIRMATEHIDKLQGLIEGLKPNESGIFEGELRNGKRIRMGVLRLSDGSFIFTADGRHYYEEPSKAVKPGFYIGTRFGEGWDNLTRGIKGIFGIGRYTGKDTAGEGGKEAREEGQRRLDASAAALANLKGDLDSPEERFEKTTEILERYQSRFKNLLGPRIFDKNLEFEGYQKQIIEEIKNTTGIDTEKIKKFFKGEILEVAGLGPDDIVKKLTTFPADAVVILAKEMRTESFAKGVSHYIEERKAGKSPDQIADLVQRGELTELDLASSVRGMGQLYAREALFGSYEEGYQRYQVASQLKGK